ncbi:unnamed protein product [Rotaria magnacalcarata]
MPHLKASNDLSTSTLCTSSSSSLSSSSSRSTFKLSPKDVKTKFVALFNRHKPCDDINLAHVVVCKCVRLIRKQSADAGFIELACEILSDPSYRESFRKYYIIHRPEETMQSDDFNNYQFAETYDNEEHMTVIKELQDLSSAIRVTSCLLLPLIMNEDEDNILTATTSDILPLLSGMIQMYNRNDERLFGFSFIELVDGLSKLMVRGRAHI